MNCMIDIHTHILPQVDDGAKDIEESLTMLKNFEQCGITAVFATSHVAPNRGFNNTKATLINIFDTLQKRVQEAAINIKLYFGSEIDDHEKLEAIIASAPTMNNTNYVLLDFGMKKADIEDITYELKIRNIKTIVAHPERYTYLDIETIRRLKKQGVLFQVSAPHLIKHGRKASQKIAKQMLKEQLIDFVASDAHHANTMNNAMQKAYDVVKKKTSLEYAEKIFIKNAETYLINNEQ